MLLKIKRAVYYFDNDKIKFELFLISTKIKIVQKKF